MLVTDKNTLRSFAPENRLWQGIPGVEVTEKGRIFTVFYSGGHTEETGNYVILCYSDDGGKIRVSLEAKGEKRILRVHNTGPAIPPEAQQRIFDRFYRVDSSHNREVEGNGLGLAIAQSIVSVHKGKITVHSAEGEGTEFAVTL